MIPRRGLIVAAAAFALAACGSGSEEVGAAGTSARSAPPVAASSASAGAAEGGSAGGTLRISGFTYDPTPLTVAPGTVVSVTNDDSAEHTVTSEQDGLFSADDISQGKTITFKAPTRAGTYTFYCAYHESMRGTLIVA